MNLISDIECLLNLKINEQANKVAKFRTFSTEILNGIKNELKLLNWEAVYQESTTEQKYNKFLHILKH